jgi:hypothetical protein
MMPTMSAATCCPSCKSTSLEPAGKDRLRCLLCGAHFMAPPPAVPPCPSCGSTCTIEVGRQKHCNSCAKDFV